MLVTVPSQADFVNLARLEADRCRAGKALQGLGIGKELAHGADLAQQSRRQLLSATGQGAKNVMVGMLFEEPFDLLSVNIELVFQSLQEFYQAQCQETLCVRDTFRATKFGGFGKASQARFIGFRSIK